MTVPMIDIANFTANTLPKPEQYAGPDIAGSFARGLGIRDMMNRSQDAARKRQVNDSLQSLFQQHGGDISSPELQKQAMGLDFQSGLALKKAAQESEVGKLKVDAAKQKLLGDNFDHILEMNAANYEKWLQLPDDQRTPESLTQGWHGLADTVRHVNPDLATLMVSGPVDPAHSETAYGLYKQRLAAKAMGKGGIGGGDPKLHSVETVVGEDGKPILIGVGSDFSTKNLGFHAWNAGKTVTGPNGQIISISGMGAQPVPTPGDPSKPLVSGDWSMKRQEQMTALRKELEGLQEVKNYKEVQPILQSARDAVGRDTKSADLNLVYAAAKVMDPGSVVRESESQMWVNAGSPAEKFQGLFSSIAGGARLTPEQRKQMMAEIESRYQALEGQYKQARGHRESIAKSLGYSPEETFLGADTSPFERRRYRGATYEIGQEITNSNGQKARIKSFAPDGKPILEGIQ